MPPLLAWECPECELTNRVTRKRCANVSCSYVQEGNTPARAVSGTPGRSRELTLAAYDRDLARRLARVHGWCHLPHNRTIYIDTEGSAQVVRSHIWHYQWGHAQASSDDAEPNEDPSDPEHLRRWAHPAPPQNLPEALGRFEDRRLPWGTTAEVQAQLRRRGPRRAISSSPSGLSLARDRERSRSPRRTPGASAATEPREIC